ncbi:MAG: hypothetical protein KIT20_02520 [Alphaproteobacteria bacterium]|nr:hypothetical protein [Alphaproteobacteria bacterium]
MTQDAREPTLRDILDEPAVQALMRSDGTDREEIVHLLRVMRLRRRWTGALSAPAGPALPASPAGSRARG